MNSQLPNRTFFQRVYEYPGHLRNYFVWKMGFCRRLRKTDPVLIYQMGKVASRSIHEPLQAVWPGEVIHCHRFEADYPQGEVQELFRYWHSPSPPGRMPIISLTRDPVSRNVSAFFQNFELYTGVRPEVSTLSTAELLDCFMQRFPHHIPLIWFQDSLMKNFGVDVYAQPFPESGAAVFPHERTPVLVMRMESDDGVKSRAVQDFLGLPGFQVQRKNTPGHMAYFPHYKRFREEVALPAAYLDRMLQSQYFNHFYGPAFEADIRGKWGGGA